MTENKPLKAIIAGGITGGVEICITYPTEYVKTQLQLSHKGLATVNYNGLLDCISQTFAKGGIAGFYRGLSVLLYGSIPKSAIDGKFSNQSKLLSGLFAGFCEAVLVVTPMETLKVKFIADQNQKIPKYKGFFSGCATILSNEGISQVYKGLFPTILKQGTNQMVRFFVMENLKDLYKERKRQKNGGDEFIYIPKLWIGLFGGTAGAASVLFNTPVDVVKTKMQGSESHIYGSSRNCVRHILKNEGLRGFYRGTIPRLSRVCLDVGITFMIYDSIMDFIKKV